MNYLMHHPVEVARLAGQHVEIVGTAIAFAAAIGIPLGIFIAHVPWLEAPIVGIAGVLYTVPSLALFAVLIPMMGLGAKPTIVALTLYSLLVIIRNTAAGIKSVDAATIDAAEGMGMTGWQRLFLVELPLGLPVILAGVRVATVASIGIATIAAYIGAGGLGVLIFDGIRTLDPDTVVAGALSTALLALVAERVFFGLERVLRRDVVAATRT